MRIVLATFGSLGDLHPVIAVGRALQARGHHAAIVTSEYHRCRVLAAGLAFHPAAPDLRPDDEALVRATMDERRGPQEVVRFMMRALPQTYADFERAVTIERADLLITSDLSVAGPILAEKLKLRWASQVLAPISFLSAFDETILPPVPWLWRLKPLGPRIYGAILRAAKYAARNLTKPVSDFRRTLGLPPVDDPFFDDKHAPDLVLAMFSRMLGVPRPDWPPQTVVTGFAFYDGQEPELAPDLAAFLEAGPPPIVFTLGSAAVFDPGRFFEESVRAASLVGRRAVLLVGPFAERHALEESRRRRLRVRAVLQAVSSGGRGRPSRRVRYDRSGHARRPADGDRALRPRSAGQRDACEQAGDFRERSAGRSTRRTWSRPR